ncbi:MAG TPA: hypothetical protein DD723_07400 [Candidatus Omnitrophica bacterium]|nr:MAG: hypothetical protein A2Z81_09310 [Omnitrophica WOR_2 bacterium GWA2_45_18]HBR15351.1 hypothetical protein [Candidatus Omnitrophota bacterium]
MKMRTLILGLAILLNSASFTHGKEEWKEYKRQHFIVYYKAAPQDFVQSVEQAAEEYYSEITTNLGFTRYKSWSWDERARIYIYDNSDDYVNAGQQAGWSHGAASPTDKVIRTFPMAHGFFDSILPHELGHIIFREFIGFNTVIPLWFEEGIAMYQEKAKRWGAHQAVKEAMKEKKFMPLNDLTHVRLDSRTHTDLVNLFYAESASIVYFLMTEFGQYRFVRFCERLKKGYGFESALAYVYVRFKTIESLNKEWERYLEK